MSTSNLENHVVSLELAKDLKTSGYPQESLFYWWVENDTEKNDVHHREPGIYQSVSQLSFVNSIAAPTASELGEQLPASINNYELVIRKGVDLWFLDYEYVYTDKKEPMYLACSSGQTEANVRAKMWLEMNKQGLLPSP